MHLTLAEHRRRVHTDPQALGSILEHYISRAEKNHHHAWVAVHHEYIDIHQAIFAQQLLAGAPIGIKDNILTKGYETSCSSKMMDGYIPPYSATCFTSLEQAGGLMIGKNNMDEFAMGASTEYSSDGVTYNPHDTTRVPGGSSGGSAAAVAADECIAALGTDTGGSVRQPAALCGVVGTKPTYGRVSRYGVQAMASSLDQVGTFTKTVEDAVLLMDAISTYDIRDATSVDRKHDKPGWYTQLERDNLQGVKLAFPKQFKSDTTRQDIQDLLDRCIAGLQARGAVVDEVDIPLLHYVVPVYYILVPAEVSTNLARFDGIRFGFQDDTMKYDDIFAYYAHIRNHGLGDEVKRRIITGSYVLSAGFYDAYYHKAQQVRKKLTMQCARLFKDYDAIIGPTTPDVAWKIGEKGDDPVQMYLEDIYTCAANLMGLPALSLPVGKVQRDGASLPFGFQIMTKHWDEANMFGIAYQLEHMMKYTK